MAEIPLPGGETLVVYDSVYTAEQIEASIGKGPIIQRGTWWVWDMATSAYIDTGVSVEDVPENVARLFGPVTVSLPAAGWTGEGPWVQQIAVEGVKAADEQLEVVYTNANDPAYAAAYRAIGLIESLDGALVFTCYGQRPVTDLTVQVLGVQ